MPATYGTLAVSPSGATLLNVLTVTTAAGTVLNEVISQIGAGTLAYGQVTISTTATSIVAARPTRTSILFSICGTTSANMFFGDASVGTGTGLLVLGIQGASFQLPTSAAISAIASGTTNVVSFLETYV
jgi:hypothetical protein